MLKNLIAQVEKPLGPPIEGLGALGTNPNVADMTLSKLLTNVVGLLSVIAFLYFGIQIILAGIKLISSSGNSDNASKAQQQITNGVIGIVVIIATVFIISGIATLLGIHNILNIETWIKNLSI